jgi:hypothetical protein
MLNQDETQTNDGMDIAVIVVDHEKKSFDFAGAGASIFLQTNEFIKQIKGTIVPVGGRQIDELRTFEKETISIDQKMILYLTSDGFQDQLGGNDHKRLASNQQFMTLIGDFNESLENKNKRLTKHFSEWKGTEEQTDDVCLIGIILNTTT